MPFDFHADWERYFNMQYENSKTSIIPFIKDFVPLKTGLKVLEIGSAEAGVLKAFTEFGAVCTGIELSPERVQRAEKFMEAEMQNGLVKFIARDIYDIDVQKDLPHRFDLIILKDVIEHIQHQEKFISRLGEFLNPDGKVFFGFPPWHMPFGGHQQVCSNKFLSRLPYFHLLPVPVYKSVLKIFGENSGMIDELLEVKETGISLSRFEKMIRKNHFKIFRKKLFLISPIYEYKFGLKTREQLSFVSAIPHFRDFFTTAGYYLIGK